MLRYFADNQNFWHFSVLLFEQALQISTEQLKPNFLCLSMSHPAGGNHEHTDLIQICASNIKKTVFLIVECVFLWSIRLGFFVTRNTALFLKNVFMVAAYPVFIYML